MSVQVELTNLKTVETSSGHLVDEAGLRRLKAIALGLDPSFPRGRAMAVLAEQPGGDTDLQAILQDEKQLSRFRSLAAMILWRLGSRVAQDVLIRSTEVRNEQVLSSVLTALGRIGDQRALDAVKKAAGHASGSAAKQARFAALLIEHRLGIKSDLPSPGSGPLEPRDESARPFEVLRASPEETAIGLRSLQREPFGIEYASIAHQIKCGQNAWMLLFNREWVSDPQWLTKQNALAGVLASRQEENRTYSVRFVFLTSPMGKGVRVVGFTTLGDPAFAGEASLRESALQFAVSALSRPGAFAFRLNAVLRPDRLDIREAMTGVFVAKKRQPTPGIYPTTTKYNGLENSNK
jgi:hypothetical protein